MSEITWDSAQKVSEIQSVHDAFFNFSQDPTEDNAVGVIMEVANNMLPCMMCNIFERQDCVSQKVWQQLEIDRFRAVLIDLYTNCHSIETPEMEKRIMQALKGRNNEQQN